MPMPGDDDRRHPSTIGGAIYLAILLVVAGAIGVTAIGDWRVGIRIFSAALGVAALARLVLPRRDAGMLAVRHRMVDVALLVGVGIALWVLAETIPNQPPLP